MIELRDIRFAYDGATVLDGVDLTVEDAVSYTHLTLPTICSV